MKVRVACLAAVGAAGLRQVDPVSALLPFAATRVNLTLRAYDGCYQWRVQKPSTLLIRDLTAAELAELGEPALAPVADPVRAPAAAIPAGCHSAVVVAPALPVDWQGVRDRSWVFAEDRNAGVRTEVYVARVAKLEVETTAKAVAVGSAETLRVKAFDAEGNVFTSLEGLVFEWTAEETRSPHGRAIALGNLNDDLYRPTAVRRAMAERRQHSDIILIKGLESGQAVVKVRLLEPGYDHVPPATVWIDVIDPFAAVPAELTVPPGAKFNAGVRLLRDHTNAAVSNFSWKSEDPAVVDVTPAGEAIATSKGTGLLTGILKVQDQRNHNNTDTSLVHVVPPTSLASIQLPLSALRPDLMQRVEAHRRAVANETFPSAEPALAEYLTNLTLSQHYPHSVSPTARESVLVKFSEGQRAVSSTSESSKQQTTWYLPVDDTHLVAMDLQHSNTSMFVPENVKFAADLQAESRKRSEALRLVWGSGNNDVMAFETGSTVGEKGTIKFTATPPFGAPLTSTVKYETVAKLGVQGLSAMKHEDGEYLSSIPVVLPYQTQVSLDPVGGSGLYRVWSSDPKVCSASVNADNQKLALGSGRSDGTAVITLQDHLHPANYFRFHCVASRVGGISFSTAKERLPVARSGGDQLPGGTETRVPVVAVAAIDTRPKVWASDKPESRTGEEQRLLGRNSVTNYWTCRELEPTLGLQQSHTETDRFTVQYRSTPLPLLRMSESNERYICGYAVIRTPQKPVRLNLDVNVTDNLTHKRIMTSNSKIEFYESLSARVHSALPSYANVTLPRMQTSSSVSSTRLENSEGLIVGGSAVIKVTGGPELQSNACTRTVEHSSSNHLAITEMPLDDDDRAEIGVMAKYRVQCLSEVPVVPIKFTLTERCHADESNSLESSTTVSIGCSLPDFIKVIPLSQTDNEMLPPLNPPVTKYKTLGDNLAGAPPLVSNSNYRLNTVCRSEHLFVGVPYDRYGRPLYGVEGNWKQAWVWYTETKPKAGHVSWSLKEHNSGVKIVSNSCDSQTHVLRSIISWQGSFADSAFTSLNRSQIDTLKQTAKAVTAKNKFTYLSDSIEVIMQTPLAFDPHQLDGPLMMDPEWAYVVRVRGASSNAKYSFTGPLNLLTVSPKPLALSSLNALGHANKIVPLYSADVGHDDEGGAAYVYFQVSEPRSATNVANATLSVFDPSLLGPNSIAMDMDLGTLNTAQLQLVDSRTGHVMSTANSQAELEMNLPYQVKILGQDGSRVFASPVNSALVFNLMATPHKLLSVSSDADNNVIVRGLRVGTGLLDGRLNADVVAHLSLVVDEPFRIEPPNLVLLPEGVRWRPKVSGGGRNAADWALVAADSKVVSTQDDNRMIESNKIGTSYVKVVDVQHVDEGLNAADLVPNHRINVTVAHPSYMKVSAGAQAIVKHRAGLTLPIYSGARVPLVASIFTADNQEFTRPALLASAFSRPEDSTVGLHAGGAGKYRCFVKWVTMSANAFAIVKGNDEGNLELVSELVGPHLDVEIFGLAPGEGQLSASIECNDSTKWFSFFKDAVTFTVRVMPEAVESMPIGRLVTLDDEPLSLHLKHVMTDERLLLPRSQYAAKTGDSLICEVTPTSTVTPRPSDASQTCGSGFTISKLSGAASTMDTGSLQATRHSLILSPLSSHPYHRREKMATILLGTPSGLSVHSSDLTTIVDEVVVEENAVDPVLTVPLSIHLVDSSGRLIEIPEQLAVSWTSSNTKVAMIEGSHVGDRFELKVYTHIPDSATLQVAVRGSEGDWYHVERTFHVRVVKKEGEPSAEALSPDTSATTEQKPKFVVRWIRGALLGILLGVGLIVLIPLVIRNRNAARPIPRAASNQQWNELNSHPAGSERLYRNDSELRARRARNYFQFVN